MLKHPSATLKTCVLLLTVSAVLCSNDYAQPTQKSGHTLRQVATVGLPGPTGKRFDYLTIDEKDGYLHSAHLGARLLYVIDLKTNTLVKTTPDVPGVEGVEFVPELDKVYTSD